MGEITGIVCGISAGFFINWMYQICTKNARQDEAFFNFFKSFIFVAFMLILSVMFNQMYWM